MSAAQGPARRPGTAEGRTTRQQRAASIRALAATAAVQRRRTERTDPTVTSGAVHTQRPTRDVTKECHSWALLLKCRSLVLGTLILVFMIEVTVLG